jgi:hypothetical protein
MSEVQERPKPKRVDSEVSSTAEEDPGYESRSRSQSRRRRRQNQRQRQSQSKAQAGNAKAESKAMTSVKEQPQEEEEQEQEEERHPDWPYAPRDQWLTNPATADTTEAQPFSRIKPPSQSMDGPVTYARMMRGEIPWRGAPPRQPYDTTQGVDAKMGGADGKDPMDQDGLKLRLELNLDIEIELKASIHGDLTLALM